MIKVSLNGVVRIYAFPFDFLIAYYLKGCVKLRSFWLCLIGGFITSY